MYLYNFYNIQSFLLSNFSDKKIAEKSGIDLELVKQLRQDAKYEEKLKDKLTWKLAEKLIHVLFNSYTGAEYQRFIKYCKQLFEDSKNNNFTIRVSRSMENNHAWNYCSIAKNDSLTGAFDRKEFKIPVTVALNCLDTEYIPHFFNPMD